MCFHSWNGTNVSFSERWNTPFNTAKYHYTNKHSLFVYHITMALCCHLGNNMQEVNSQAIYLSKILPLFIYPWPKSNLFLNRLLFRYNIAAMHCHIYCHALYILHVWGLTARNWQKWKKYIPYISLPWNL